MIKSSNIGGGVGSNNKKKRGYRRPTNIVTDKEFNRISSPVFFVDPPNTPKFLTPKGNMPIRSRMETEHPLKNPNAVATPNTIPPQIVPYIPKDDPMQNIIRVVQQLSVSLPANLGLSFDVISDSIVHASTSSPASIGVLPNPQQTPPTPAQITNADLPKLSTNSENDVVLPTVSVSGEPASGVHNIAVVKASTQIGIGKLDHYDVFGKVVLIPLDPILHIVLNLEDVDDNFQDRIDFFEVLTTLEDRLTIGEGFMPSGEAVNRIEGKLLRFADILPHGIDTVTTLIQIAMSLSVTVADSINLWLDNTSRFVVNITPVTFTVGDNITNWLDNVAKIELVVKMLSIGDSSGASALSISGLTNVPMPTNLATAITDWLGPIDIFALDPVNPYIFAGTAVFTTNTD